jgi:hypothetical protein
VLDVAPGGCRVTIMNWRFESTKQVAPSAVLTRFGPACVKNQGCLNVKSRHSQSRAVALPLPFGQSIQGRRSCLRQPL